MNPPTDPNPSAAPAPPVQYEFNAEQNRVIDELADALSWIRVPLLVIAGAYGVSSLGHFVRVGKDTETFGRVSVRFGSEAARGTVTAPPS